MSGPSRAGRRLDGLDLARFVAIAGMVLVHARDVLAELAAGSGAWPLVLVQAAATNRARLLFFLLAGVGTALLVARRGRATTVLLRRAGFLAVLGVVLVVLGWDDLVLVFYGILFVLAVVLVRLSDRGLLAVALATGAPGVMRLASAPHADDTLTNVLLVAGEVVPVFCLGLVVGRLDLADARTVRRVALVGALLAAPGTAVLALSDSLDLTTVQGRLEPVAALTSTAGLCLVVLAACVLLTLRATGRWAPLVTAGSMPLSAYVGHALLFTLLVAVTDLRPGPAAGVAVGYLAVLVVGAGWWHERHPTGPLEAVLRRVG